MHGMLFSRGGKQEFPLHLQVAALKAKSGSAACVCQWTNLVEIKKATPKATLIFLVVLESLVDQSSIFWGTFFFKLKIQCEFDRISTKFTNVSNSSLQESQSIFYYFWS